MDAQKVVEIIENTGEDAWDAWFESLLQAVSEAVEKNALAIAERKE